MAIEQPIQTEQQASPTPPRHWLSWLGFKRRVPVITQMTKSECGAACLAMVLTYYGRRTKSSELREAIGIGRDGTSAKTLVQTARKYGLRTRAYSIHELDELEHLHVPAILHWGFAHYVVLEAWSKDEIKIVDPALGRRVVQFEEFSNKFTGIAMTFEPGPHFSRAKVVPADIEDEVEVDHTPVWRRYAVQLARTPGVVAFLLQVLVASVGLQLLGLITPLLTKILIDTILPLQMDNMLEIVGLGLLIMIAAQFVITYLRQTMLIYLQARVDTQLMLGFFEHILSLPFKFFQQRNSGDLIMRLTSNTVIRETLTSQSISVVLDGAFILVYLGILMHEEWTFGAVALVLGLLQVAVLLLTNRRVHDLMERDLSAQADSQSYLVEAMGGIGMLKASGNEHQALDSWSNLFFKQLNVSIERNYLLALTNTFLKTLSTFSPIILMWFGAQLVIDGDLTLGTMLALNTLAISFLTPLSSLVSTSQQLQLVGAHLNRIADVLEAEPDQNPLTVKDAPELSGRIEVKDVSFKYDPNAPYALQDVNFTIEPGQKIALVGPTGSGKSTLAMLLLGLYSPTKGQVLYDGLDLQTMEYRGVRQQMGVVLQESTIFSNTIRQNIAFNNPDMSMDEIIEAAKLACIHEEINRLPMGYETALAENGIGLSGGQRQRLALARALAHQPKFLILDEATSHLDAETERQVDKQLQRLSCTRVVIAHRLSTVREADMILVMFGGQIVERGTHQELLKRGGMYTLLVNGQLEQQAAPTDATVAALLYGGVSSATNLGFNGSHTPTNQQQHNHSI